MAELVRNLGARGGRARAPVFLLFCLITFLVLGMAINVSDFVPRATVGAPGSSSPYGDQSVASTHLQTIGPPRPPGFVPSVNFKGVLPSYSTSSYENPAPGALNDGYCYYGNKTCGQLAYHGGVIMHNASIVLVLWAGCGSSGCISCSSGYFDNSTIDPRATNPNDCAYGNLQVAYFEDFCAAGNPLLAVINQYTDHMGNLHSCSVYGGKWYGDYNQFPEKPLTDADIQTEAMAVIKGMNMSASTNTAVFIFTPYGISSCLSSSNCFPRGSFCAYHSWFWSGAPYLSPQVVYASVPDGGWAGANCGLGGPSPNHDPFADLEVSPLSHEAAEMFTDPTPGYIFGDGWYHGGFLEIGDECAYDFTGTQPSDGSNVHLGQSGTAGRPYRIQSEWSNRNGGCTFDLRGPPILFQETIYPDVSTGTVASQQNFSIDYQEAGETGAYSTFKSSCCGAVTDFYVTLGTYSFTNPVINSSERWCFDQSCGPVTTYAAGPIFLGFYYFDLLRQITSYRVVGGGSTPPPILSFRTAPWSTSEGDNTVASTLALNGSGQEFWALRGSSIVVPSVLASSPTERWITQKYAWSAGSADSVPATLTWYHEYSLIFSYAVADGGAPSIPIVSFTEFGSPQQLFLSNAPTPYWVDSGTEYSVTNPLSGSTTTERWITKSVSGTTNASATVLFEYYHQFYIGYSYNIVDGGSPTPPSLQVQFLGFPLLQQMSETPAFTWADANSWSAPPILGNSTTERWAAPGVTDGPVSSNSSITLSYYHQFSFEMGYLVSDTSFVAGPILTSEVFGSTSHYSLGKLPATYWLDNGGSWSLSHVLNGSGTLERWVTNSQTDGVVSASVAASFEYLHEYYLTIQSLQPAGGSLTPSGWYNASTSLQLTANANAGWSFERWDGTGNGAYSGNRSNPAVTMVSHLVEKATFYPGLVLINSGAGQVSYRWGANQGSLEPQVPLYVPVGTNVTLSATPSSTFFVFGGYTGPVAPSSGTASVLVDGPITITASFNLNFLLLGALFGSIAAAGVLLVYLMTREKRGGT